VSQLRSGLDREGIREPVAGVVTAAASPTVRAASAGPRAVQLMQGRLRAPQPRLELVERTDLLATLQAPGPALVVVAAPGGYGKTVALTQWASRDPRPAAWLQVDEADNDPLLFLSYLAAAVGSVADVDPAVARWLMLAAPPVVERIVPSLAASVVSASPFVLVIDDAHLLTNELCWQVLDVLLQQVPSGSRACVSGRAAPPLPLARLDADGRLLEIGPHELAMNAREAAELLRLHGVAADGATVAYLGGVTEGWAAGLYMAALAGRQRPSDEWLDGIRGHQHGIARYLASEVLERQPENIREFFVQTSILERLSANLCRAVTRMADAEALLRRIALDNLFISALDDHDQWYRYHHLFAEFLRAELERRDEAEVAALHGRAAAGFEQHGQLEEAVRHWLAAGEVRRAGAIVCRAYMEYSRRARLETIRRWLDMFTDEQIRDDDALTLTAGWIGSMTGDKRARGLWTTAALRERVDDTIWPGGVVSLKAMQAALRAAIGRDGLTVMLADAERAEELSQNAELVERAALHTVLGVAHWLKGDVDSAIAAFSRAEDEGAVANAIAEIGAAGMHANLLADLGFWSEAEALVSRAMGLMDESGFSWVPVVTALLAHARLLARRGDPEADERAAAVGALLQQAGMPPWMALISEVLLAEVLFDRGDVAGAERWTRAGFVRLAAWPDAGILGPRLERLRARLDGLRLSEPLTRAERRVLELLPTELSLKEIAVRLHVSRDTVKSHVGDLYRKLAAHARSEAVSRARELGLLPRG
jgi:LuxR family maltose regulon positive regulatory protein